MTIMAAASPFILSLVIARFRCLQHEIGHQMCQQQAQKQFYPHNPSNVMFSKSLIAVFSSPHWALVDLMFTAD